MEEALWTLMGIEHRTTTPHHPRCNQQQEHQNKTMAQYMRCILMDADKSSIEWESYLPFLMLAVNTAVNKATKQSPFYTMFGYDARLPLWGPAEDIIADELFSKAGPHAKEVGWAWRARQNSARRAAYAANQHAHDQQESGSQLLPAADGLNLRIGQLAWAAILPVAGTNKKFAPKYEKVVISARLGRDTYKVKRMATDGRRKFLTLNVEHLKPARLDDEAPAEEA